MRRRYGGVECGARGRGSHPRTREAWGNRPGPLRGSAFDGWTQVWTKAGESRPAEGVDPLSHTRKHGPQDRKAALARREAPAHR